MVRKKQHDCNDYRSSYTSEYDRCRKCGRLLDKTKQGQLIDFGNAPPCRRG